MDPRELLEAGKQEIARDVSQVMFIRPKSKRAKAYLKGRLSGKLRVWKRILADPIPHNEAPEDRDNWCHPNEYIQRFMTILDSMEDEYHYVRMENLSNHCLLLRSVDMDCIIAPYYWTDKERKKALGK